MATRLVLEIHECNHLFILKTNDFSVLLTLILSEFELLQTFVYGDLYRYDVEKQEWKLITSPNSPPPCSAHQAVAWKNNLYIFGKLTAFWLNMYNHSDIHKLLHHIYSYILFFFIRWWVYIPKSRVVPSLQGESSIILLLFKNTWLIKVWVLSCCTYISVCFVPKLIIMPFNFVGIGLLDVGSENKPMGTDKSKRLP